MVWEHPKDDLSLWGSLPEYGKEIGMDENAISSDGSFKVYTERGLGLNERLKKGVVIGSGVRGNNTIRNFVNQNPKLKVSAKWVS